MSKQVRYYITLILLLSMVGIYIDVYNLNIDMYSKLFILAILLIWAYSTFKLYNMFMVVKKEEELTYTIRKELAPKYGNVESTNIDNETNAKTVAYHLNQNRYESLTDDKKIKLNEKGDK